jgi:hypothetical protein
MKHVTAKEFALKPLCKIKQNHRFVAVKEVKYLVKDAIFYEISKNESNINLDKSLFLNCNIFIMLK